MSMDYTLNGIDFTMLSIGGFAADKVFTMPCSSQSPALDLDHTEGGVAI